MSIINTLVTNVNILHFMDLLNKFLCLWVRVDSALTLILNFSDVTNFIN